MIDAVIGKAATSTVGLRSAASLDKLDVTPLRRLQPNELMKARGTDVESADAAALRPQPQGGPGRRHRVDAPVPEPPPHARETSWHIE